MLEILLVSRLEEKEILRAFRIRGTQKSGTRKGSDATAVSTKLRSTFVSHWVMRGVNLPTVQHLRAYATIE